MRFAFWIRSATDTHSSLFHGNDGHANASQCYVYTYNVCLVGMPFCRPFSSLPSEWKDPNHSEAMTTSLSFRTTWNILSTFSTKWIKRTYNGRSCPSTHVPLFGTKNINKLTVMLNVYSTSSISWHIPVLHLTNSVRFFGIRLRRVLIYSKSTAYSSVALFITGHRSVRRELEKHDVAKPWQLILHTNIYKLLGEQVQL